MVALNGKGMREVGRMPEFRNRRKMPGFKHGVPAPPGSPCASRGAGRQPLLTFSTPRGVLNGLAEEKRQGRKRETGRHSKEANTRTLGLPSSLGLPWGATLHGFIGPGRLRGTQTHNCQRFHGGTVLLALQSINRIIHKTNLSLSPFVFFKVPVRLTGGNCT